MRIQLGQTERHKLGKPWVGFYTFTFVPYIEKATENNCLGSCCIQDWLCKWNKPQLKPQGWSIAKWEWATWSCSSRSPIGWKVFGWNVLILHIISGVRQSMISIMVGIGMYNGILIEYDHHVPIGILVLLNFNGSRVTQGSRACLAAPSPAPSPAGAGAFQGEVPQRASSSDADGGTGQLQWGHVDLSAPGRTSDTQKGARCAVPLCAGGCCEVCCGMDDEWGERHTVSIWFYMCHMSWYMIFHDISFSRVDRSCGRCIQISWADPWYSMANCWDDPKLALVTDPG